MKKLRGAKCMTAVTGFVLGAAFLFTACGDDITEVTEVNKNAGVAVLAAGEKISSVACDTANAGEVMFAVDSSAMFMCDGKRWTSINGRDGKNGNKGDDGKSCSIKQNADKSLTITCETEKGQVSYDVKGGSNGMDAVSDDGAICKVSKKSGVATIVCKDADGKIVSELKIADGKDGEPGENGSSCKMEDDESGIVKVVCGDENNATEIAKGFCGVNLTTRKRVFAFRILHIGFAMGKCTIL